MRRSKACSDIEIQCHIWTSSLVVTRNHRPCSPLPQNHTYNLSPQALKALLAYSPFLITCIPSSLMYYVLCIYVSTYLSTHLPCGFPYLCISRLSRRGKRGGRQSRLPACLPACLRSFQRAISLHLIYYPSCSSHASVNSFGLAFGSAVSVSVSVSGFSLLDLGHLFLPGPLPTYLPTYLPS